MSLLSPSSPSPSRTCRTSLRWHSSGLFSRPAMLRLYGVMPGTDRAMPQVAQLRMASGPAPETVSYTHLTLPTICSV
eukprot:3341080-Rhodomonas_salina.1